jgi:ribosomal protein S13
MITPELQPILQSIFARLKALEDAKAKTLTDEEIRAIHQEIDGNLNMIEFARAILKKSQGV